MELYRLIIDSLIAVGSASTAVLLFLTWIQIKDNRENNQVSQRAQVGLRVFKTVEYGSKDNNISYMFLELFNNGKTPAHNVNINSLREFDYQEMEAHKSNPNMIDLSIVNKAFIKSTEISYVATGEKIKFPFIDVKEYFQYIENKNIKDFSFEISWENFDKSVSKELISINIEEFRSAVMYSDDEEYSRIQQISKNLKEINETMNKISIEVKNPIMIKNKNSDDGI